MENRLITGWTLFGIGVAILGMFFQTPEGIKILNLQGNLNYLLLVSAILLFVLAWLSGRKGKKK